MTLDLTHYTHLIYNKLGGWAENIVASLPNLAVAIVVVIAFYFGARLGRYLTHKLGGKFIENKTLGYLFSSLVFILIISLGILLALDILNLEKAVTSLLAGAGVIGLALGFAFQDISANLISGVFITFRKPFKVGDIIETQNYFGKVDQIDLRVTTLRTFQGLHVLVPNKDVQNSPLVNYTKTQSRRVDLEVGVSYGENLDEVKRITTETLENLDFRIKDLDVGVFFTEFGSSSINMVLHIWIQYPDEPGYLTGRSETIMAIKKAYDTHGITIPFPIRTLDFGIKGGKTLSQMSMGTDPQNL